MSLIKKHAFILTVIFLAASVLFWGNSSNFLIDFSREINIPYQMTTGDKLIKDIYLIYGFWGYFFNYLLFKICTNINVLLIESTIISYAVVLFFYFIVKKLENSATAFFFSIILILCSIFSSATFSFIVPYSYSILWGYFASFGIIYCYFYKKLVPYYILIGLLFVSKPELAILFVIFDLTIHFIKKIKIKPQISLILIFPLINLFYLIINQISFNDLLNNFLYLKNMIKSSTLIYFYKGMGVLFNKEYFIFSIKALILNVLCFSLSYFLYNKEKKRKIFSIILITLFFILFNQVFVFNLLVFIILALFILLNFKNKINENDVILLIFSLFLSLKCLFAMNIFGYGNFGFIFGIFVLYKYLLKLFDIKFVKFYLGIYLVILAILNVSFLFYERKIPYKTNFGTAFLKKSDYNNFVYLDKFIKNSIKDNETLVILPEGQIFNFLNQKKWSNYNATFTPLDFETFGDKYLIDKLKENNTDYVVFFPRSTEEYKKTEICKDYAVDFCSYIMDNYDRVDKNNNDVVIYKIKNK